jgi:hypothetical protein
MVTACAVIILKRICTLSVEQFSYVSQNEARGSIVVKALYYKLEGRGFDTR